MRTASLVAVLVCALSGCTQSLLNSSVMEKRVVQQFTDAIAEENESALRKVTSSRFEEKAMSSEDALTDLRVVHLPTGKLSVVEVNREGQNRREVIVKEDSGGKYQFHLVHDTAKGYWVVDDVMVRQNRKGTRVTKSTTDVMDLLMTLRRFLNVWEQGSREEILAMTSPELTRSLETLPDNWLTALTAKTASVYEEGMARKPEANLTDEDAVVKLPARNGHIMMKIVRGDGGWVVDDVEVHNHRSDEHPGSVRRQADAINTVSSFLAAYEKQDREALEQVAGRKLYEGALRFADLSMVRLPEPDGVAGEFDIRAYESRLTVMLPAGKEVVRLDLRETNAAEREAATTAPRSSQRFMIEEVTLYDRSSRRQRSLSAVFTAPTRASMFFKALASRDHTVLSQMSTAEFSRGTWERIKPETLPRLSIPDLFDGGIQLTDSHTVAGTTELQFRNSQGLALSCRMHQQAGSLKIDDIQYPDKDGRIASLRTQLELRIPILEFAAAWNHQDLKALQASCSSDFNRLVWTHLDAVPSQFGRLGERLNAAIADTRITQERATVKLAGGAFGMPVVANLVTEHGYWVMDEIRMEQSPGQIVGVREKLRGQIAARLLNGSYSMVHSAQGQDRVIPVNPKTDHSVSAIQQASGEFMRGDSPAAVRHANYERYMDADAESGANTGNVHRAIHTTPVDDDGTTGVQTFAEAHAAGSRESKYEPDAPVSDVRTDSGMTVFGPQATAVARSLDKPFTAADLTRPIDMTEESPNQHGAAFNGSTPHSAERNAGRALPEQNSDNTDSDFMYFGPDRKVLNTKADDTAKMTTEPADAPIAIE